MKYILIGILSIVFVVGLFLAMQKKDTPVQQPPVVVEEIQYKDLVHITTPLPGSTVVSPLTITGRARGYWYFEASFPVQLLDGNGNEIAIKPAQAIGDWMTEEYVTFSVTLTFTTPATATGTLILQKDNPSGEPQFDDFVSIPITF